MPRRWGAPFPPNSSRSIAPPRLVSYLLGHLRTGLQNRRGAICVILEMDAGNGRWEWNAFKIPGRGYRRWARTKSQEEDGMGFPRRQLLQTLSYALGSKFIVPQIALAMSAQNPAQPASAAEPAKAAAKHESGGTEMEKVAGIGGLFFRAHDPKALGNWYLLHVTTGCRWRKGI